MELALKAGRVLIETKHGTFDLVEYVSVTSSNVQKIGYTTDEKLLVEFKGGTEYLYSNVPKEEYEKLRDAESVGVHLNKEIKNKYECNKVVNV
jgi:hypothetical protein